jgi:folate-binding protein YgfZ
MPCTYAALPSRALIRIDGNDWRPFLQGLLSNDVLGLETGRQRFAAMLTPQGRFLFDVFVIAGPDGCLLDVQAAQRASLLTRLLMYRLRAKVEIAAADGTVAALWGLEEAPEGWAPDPRLDALGFRGVDLAPPPGADVADEAAYDALRLRLGAPDPSRDCIPDRTYPIEADFDLLGGIDFAKGCFVGQETTSRMKRRGGIRSRMLPLVFEGEAPPFGTEVLAGELRAGEVLSGGPGRAIALLRLDRALDAELTAAGRPVRVDLPDWYEDQKSPR